MRSKKAQVEGLYFVMLEVVMVTVVILAFLWNVQSIQNKTSYQKDFLAKDTALLVNTLHSAPGNIHYTYSPFDVQNIQLQKFDYKIEESKSKVKDKGTDTRYPYASNNLISNKLDFVEKPTSFEYLFTGDTFSFGKELSPAYYSISKLSSDNPELKLSFVSGIIADPKTNQSYSEGSSFLDYGLMTSSSSTNPKLADSSTRTAFLLLQLESSDFPIGIRKSDSLRIYVSSEGIEDSRYLASLFAENLQKYTSLKHISIIPTESSKRAMLIEVDEKILVEDSNGLKQSLSEAVGEYSS